MLPEALARQIISDHERRPRNRRPLPGQPSAALENPGCGDQVRVWVQWDAGRLQAATFEGRGCAISQASASLMTVALTGLWLSEVQERVQAFEALVMGQTPADPLLGDLLALAGVSRLHARRRCALLPWRALQAALTESDTPAS